MSVGIKITQAQYLLFRVLWPNQKSLLKTNLAKYGLGAYIHQASNFLNRFPPFVNFIGSVRQSAETSRTNLEIPLIFRYLKDLQDPDINGISECRCPAASSHPRQTRQAQPALAQVNVLHIPRSIDEDTVNASLVSYLAALTLKLPNVGSHSRQRSASFWITGTLISVQRH
jgi:hypothetical protein